jgi:hypothetical protein
VVHHGDMSKPTRSRYSFDVLSRVWVMVTMLDYDRSDCYSTISEVIPRFAVLLHAESPIPRNTVRSWRARARIDHQ